MIYLFQKTKRNKRLVGAMLLQYYKVPVIYLKKMTKWITQLMLRI